ncbi:MAG: hypothetical protein ACQEV0_03930 [Bacillota bacterium]
MRKINKEEAAKAMAIAAFMRSSHFIIGNCHVLFTLQCPNKIIQARQHDQQADPDIAIADVPIKK